MQINHTYSTSITADSMANVTPILAPVPPTIVAPACTSSSVEPTSQSVIVATSDRITRKFSPDLRNLRDLEREGKPFIPHPERQNEIQLMIDQSRAIAAAVQKASDMREQAQRGNQAPSKENENYVNLLRIQSQTIASAVQKASDLRK